MFRSKRRPIVFPQAEHARLAGAIALAWRREDVPLSFDSFVAGVTLHDRGYGEHDDDPIGGKMTSQHWVAIQRRGFTPRGEDAVVDLVTALHIRRLMTPPEDDVERAARDEIDALLPELYDAAGTDAETAAAADAITNVCDRLAFEFCFEEPASGTVRGFDYTVDGHGAMTLAPWPLRMPQQLGLLVAYRADGYPRELEPVVVPFELRPG